MYDHISKKPWNLINIPADKFPARQGLGVAQMNREELLIFGGFNGKFMKDTHIFNPVDNSMRVAENQASVELFSFQMPTVFDESKGIVYTVDW